jgi:hypothetical protein
MQSRPIFPYISFGTIIRYLQDVNVGDRIHGERFILENIEALLRKLDQLNLVVTKRSPRIQDLIRLKEELVSQSSDHILSNDEADRLRAIIKDLRLILTAETSGKFAFIVTEKRIDVQKLLSDVKSLMPTGIFEALPNLAKYDFEQAGRAIAFELPTAAAFHLLRGTEAVFREFYCKIVKRGRVKQLLWGDMINSLESRRKPPPKEITQLLEHIKNSFRNPTQHPEKIYEIDEAQSLFNLCTDTVSRMINYLQDLNLK